MQSSEPLDFQRENLTVAAMPAAALQSWLP